MKRAVQRPKVGLVVEGDAEFHALPYLHTKAMVPGCPPLQAANCGGIGGDVTAAGVANRVHKKVIGHLAAGRADVVVCVDRERRDQDAAAFAHEIAQALDKTLAEKGFADARVHVVVADRAFEAWILADARGLHRRGKFASAPGFTSFEGNLGKRGRLGKVEVEDLLGRSYSETRDGPALFAHVDVTVARDFGPGKGGSASFDRLLKALGV
jgi:hypothetical protein